MSKTSQDAMAAAAPFLVAGQDISNNNSGSNGDQQPPPQQQQYYHPPPPPVEQQPQQPPQQLLNQPDRYNVVNYLHEAQPPQFALYNPSLSSQGRYAHVSSSVNDDDIAFDPRFSTFKSNDPYMSSSLPLSSSSSPSFLTLWMGLIVLFSANALWVEHALTKRNFDRNELFWTIEVCRVLACLAVDHFVNGATSSFMPSTPTASWNVNGVSAALMDATQRVQELLFPHGFWNDGHRMALAPMLQFVQTTLLSAGLARVSIRSAEVQGHTKLLVVATVSIYLLQRHYSWPQWLCLIVITVGDELQVWSDVLWSWRLDGHADEDTYGGNDRDTETFLEWLGGLCMVLVATVAGAVALVYLERMLKGTDSTLSAAAHSHSGQDITIWKRGAQNAVFAALIWTLLLAWSCVSRWPTLWFFHGFTLAVWMLILAQTAVYLWSLVVLAYLDSVHYTLALTMSYMVSDVIAIVVTRETKLSFVLVVGMALTLTGVYYFHVMDQTVRNTAATAATMTGGRSSSHGTETAAARSNPMLPLSTDWRNSGTSSSSAASTTFENGNNAARTNATENFGMGSLLLTEERVMFE